MDELIRKRGRVKAKLTRVSSFLDQLNITTASVNDLTVRLDMLNPIWTEFDTTQVQIESSCSDDDMSSHQSEQEDFEQKYYLTKSRLLSFRDRLYQDPARAQPAHVTSTTTPIGMARQEDLKSVRLPTLELPTFSGNYQEWVSFADLFKAVIHSNRTLSQVQKLQYLKASIKGEAARLLTTISVTEANYTEAWKILSDRYSNTKQIIQSHLAALHSQPKAQTESPVELRRLVDTTTEHVRALSALGQPTDHWDCLIVFMVVERIDSTTRKHWELESTEIESPTFTDLKLFIEKRCRALEATACTSKPPAASNKQMTSRATLPKTISYQTTVSRCVLCNQGHPLFRCKKFLAQSVSGRIETVSHRNLCFNCLKSGHSARNCQSSHCRQCEEKHNTLLHKVNREHREASSVPQSKPVIPDSVANHHGTRQVGNARVILATAMVTVKNSRGQNIDVRAMLDCGSQTSFVDERCLARLGLVSSKASVKISGIGGVTAGTSKGHVQLDLGSKCSSYRFELSALVLRQITGILPQMSICPSMVSSVVQQHSLKLADPNYHTPGPIDMLIGADWYYHLLLPGQFSPVEGELVIQNTQLGWVIAGRMPSEELSSITQSHHALEDLECQIRRFWEIEEIPQGSSMNAEAERCEIHFKQTHHRSPTGRFIVELPFRETPVVLGDTRPLALRRLHQVESRLQRNPLHKQEYVRFMVEYEQLGHMELVTDGFQSSKQTPYYLPHHYVVKSHEAAPLSGFRVVFDGTAPPPDGPSLNKSLMVGATLQHELPDIITNFRRHVVAFTADIGKMYRQILVHPRHRDYQRILWRGDPNDPIKEYRLCTVTYGTSAASFLATRCVMELAEQAKSSHPLAYPVVKNDFYVDDVLSGGPTVEEAINTQQQLIQLLSEAGLGFHKWASNNPLLMDAIPAELKRIEPMLDFVPEIKTLGVFWNPTLDQFGFRVDVETSPIVSKRTILSRVSRLFDPLGWVAPVVVCAKILIQRLWLLPVGWDGPLQVDVVQEWLTYSEALRSLEAVHIPRRISTLVEPQSFQLHGFCDASEKAYGAVVYFCTADPTMSQVSLVRSKSRVAPLKQISLPRLELCGAVLLARLVAHIRTFFTLSDSQVYLWTDSTIVLSWLARPPRYWKTFVANRVSEVQQNTSPACWNHVKSSDNPADCLSRGVSPLQLLHNSLWWSGPPWLLGPEEHWPGAHTTEHFKEGEALSEQRRVPDSVTLLTTPAEWSARFSSWTRMSRVMAYCFRFVNNCRSVPSERKKSHLTIAEIEHGQHFWYRQAQSDVYAAELRQCRMKNPVAHGSKLRSLNPFLDDLNILRVGGRISHASMSFSRRHPIILPHHHAITRSIVEGYHSIHLHAGPMLLMGLLCHKYWIVGLRSLARQIVHWCVKCFRLRVMPARPFSRCGVDYAGPIVVKAVNGRGRVRTSKSYICLFVCFVTKAVHLELVGDLTTNTFLAALKRFVSRRGRPADIFSDCGTNFKGANNQLKELDKFIHSPSVRDQVNHFATLESINWHFSPPMSPHFGGLWEAGVKSAKYHLRRVVGATLLTYEELLTVLIQIEACLNSRPICPLSDDPHDLDYLTPGHFLIGDSLKADPDPSASTGPASTVGRWQLVQRCFAHFWARWRNEYLATLQQRPKWLTPRPNLQVGDLVLMKDKSAPPFNWPLARIVKVFPGADGLVRVVTLKTSSGILKRSITSCCPLPLDTPSHNGASVEDSFKAGGVFKNC